MITLWRGDSPHILNS